MNWGMKMTEQNHLSDAGLDALFEAAKRDAMPPDTALLARVMADARQVQAGFEAAPMTSMTMTAAAAAHQPKVRSRVALFEGLFDMIGGWGGLGGLATASAFGLWLGMSQSLGLGDGLGLSDFGTAANLESLGAEYDYLAGLGEV